MLLIILVESVRSYNDRTTTQDNSPPVDSSADTDDSVVSMLNISITGVVVVVLAVAVTLLFCMALSFQRRHPPRERSPSDQREGLDNVCHTHTYHEERPWNGNTRSVNVTTIWTPSYDAILPSYEDVMLDDNYFTRRNIHLSAPSPPALNLSLESESESHSNRRQLANIADAYI